MAGHYLVRRNTGHPVEAFILGIGFADDHGFEVHLGQMAFALHIVESDVFLPRYLALLGGISIAFWDWTRFDVEAFSEHCTWAGDEIHAVLIVYYDDNVRDVDALGKIVVDNDGRSARPFPVR